MQLDSYSEGALTIIGFNPFLGGAALSLPIAHANQACLASALSSIP